MGLKKQVTISYVVVFGISLLLMTTVFITVYLVANNAIEVGATDGLTIQTETQVRRTLEASQKFLTTLLDGMQKLPSLYTQAYADAATRAPQYSLNPLPVYRSFGVASLGPPVTTIDPVWGPLPVSYSRSSLHVPMTTASSNLTAAQASIAQDSTYLDVLFRALTPNSRGVISSYLARQPPAGGAVSVHYPGVVVDPAYDAASKEWFSTSRALQRSLIFSPEYDVQHGWIIRLCNFQSTNADPVTSCVSLKLSQIRDTLSAVKFKNTGKVSLIERKTGIVVADPELDVTSTEVKLWSNLTSPVITQTMWDELNLASTSTIRTASHVITSQALAGFEAQYLLIAFVNQSEIEAPAQFVSSDVRLLNIIVVVCLVVGFLAVTTLVILSVVRLVTGLLAPLDQIRSDIGAMVKNVGHENLLEGTSLVVGGVGDEEQQLVSNFNELMVQMQQSRQKASSVWAANERYVEGHFKISGGQPAELRPLTFTVIDDAEAADVEIEEEHDEMATLAAKANRRRLRMEALGDAMKKDSAADAADIEMVDVNVAAREESATVL